MELKKALTDKKKDIVALWIERTLDSYISPGFFKKATDPFANPVGSSITTGLTRLFDALLEGSGGEGYAGPLDQVVRIRAVQEFTPAQAIAPFLELKWVIRQIFSSDKAAKPLIASLDHLDCEIDRIALAAFDVYSGCREQVYQNRVDELKSGRSIITGSICPSALLKQERKKVEQQRGN